MIKTLIAVSLLALSFGSFDVPQGGQNNVGFMGRWNLTGTGTDSGVVYWLQVSEEDGVVKGRFLNRASSPYDLPHIKIENGELSFWNALREGQTAPSQIWRARLVNGKLVGTTTSTRQDGTTRVINWIGVRPPTWPANLNANGKHTYGKPVSLFDGTSMDAWGVQHTQNPMNWSVIDGAMTSAEKGGNNLVSKEKFQDFKLEAEFKVAPKSNGGIYLRGRYEMQVLDDAGQPITPQSQMSIYGRTPPLVNASKPADEWQTVEIIVVGNVVSATLNGQKVQDNAVIGGITGGALDANEDAPGPIMLQGDHGKVAFRKVVVTPILKAGS